MKEVSMTPWVIRLIFVGILLGCFILISANDSTVHAQEVVYHTVRPGESLSRIARRYGVSVGAITGANGISNPNLVRPGQVLSIPVPSRVAANNLPASPNTYTPPTPTRQVPVYTPRATPTPSARSLATSPELYPTPTPTRPVEVTRFYTVRPNDTLYGIASRFGASVAAIKARNRLYGDVIFVGQLLAIP
jgi:spore germination protein